MHYGILVIVNPMDDIDAAVADAMEPYGDGKEWDWFQIGGRWTGHFDGYDPERDPANIQTCDLCGGTGDRADLTPPEWKAKCGGCNGCHGKGQKSKWPTQWKRHSGDVKPVEALTAKDVDLYAICVEGYGWQAKEVYRPFSAEPFVPLPMPSVEEIKAKFPHHLAVVVDCHN